MNENVTNIQFYSQTGCSFASNIVRASLHESDLISNPD